MTSLADDQLLLFVVLQLIIYLRCYSLRSSIPSGGVVTGHQVYYHERIIQCYLCGVVKVNPYVTGRLSRGGGFTDSIHIVTHGHAAAYSRKYKSNSHRLSEPPVINPIDRLMRLDGKCCRYRLGSWCCTCWLTII